MEADLPIEGDLVIPGGEIWFTASRSSGPGGQNVNKTSTRVILHWQCLASSALSDALKQRLKKRLGGRITADGILLIQVEDTRSQQQNREIARQRLAELVRSALRKRKKRVPTEPTAGSQQRRLDTKKKHAEIKKARGPAGIEE